MTRPRLSRASGDFRPAAPVRLVHLGLGNFFRAHQACYTEHAPDAAGWGYAAFAGRSTQLAQALTDQDGLYTLLVRGPDHDAAEVIGSVSEARPGLDHDGWLAAVASAETAVITVTVTEAGYYRGPDGGLDTTKPQVAADVARLRANATAPVKSVPARLVAGLAARRCADGGPVSLVPCDNVPGNGGLTHRVVTDMAGLVDPALAEWIASSISVVTTVVDRITPHLRAGDATAAEAMIGRRDEAPVVTEPYSEWVMAGEFPAGRPRWEESGAIFTEDLTGYEHRKLWLLNGAHSLLAYGGSILGYRTVADAIGDDRCREWVQQWWTTAAGHLGQSDAEVATYQGALLRRFANRRMHDQLARIAEDGSQKLPIRILPVLRAERASGRLPISATRILAAWLCHLRGSGAPVRDVCAEEFTPIASGPIREASRRVLDRLDPDLGADEAVISTVAEQCRQLTASVPR